MTKPTEDTLYREYRDKVLAYLKSRLESVEDANDLCHDVFLKVFRSLPRYDETKSSISTWIFRITRFTLIDYIRTKHPVNTLTEDMPAADDMEDKFMQKETLGRLAVTLATLEQDERDIIIMRYYNGYSLTDISGIIGISYGMVKVKHRKALGKISAKLE